MGIKFDGHGITFDSAGSRSFGNDFVRNVVIFGVGNTSSSQADNRKNNFLILGEVPTYGINVSFGSPEKKFNINFTKTNTKFCSVLHYNPGNSYLLVNGKEIFKFKADNKNVNFPTQFVSELFLMNKSEILNIHKHLMTKNNKK